MLQRSIVYAAAQHCAAQLPHCTMPCRSAAMLQRNSQGVGGGRALRGALASGGYANKIFLYNKLPT